MPKVRAAVNLMDANFRRVTLLPGDEIPDWALSRITNPALLLPGDDAAKDAPVNAAPTVAQASPPSQSAVVGAVDYSGLSKDELVAALKVRQLDAKGNKPELIARLEEADKAAATELEEVDVWGLDVSELEALATERGIDLGEASTQAEIATIIQQAGE